MRTATGHMPEGVPPEGSYQHAIEYHVEGEFEDYESMQFFCTYLEMQFPGIELYDIGRTHNRADSTAFCKARIAEEKITQHNNIDGDIFLMFIEKACGVSYALKVAAWRKHILTRI